MDSERARKHKKKLAEVSQLTEYLSIGVGLSDAKELMAYEDPSKYIEAKIKQTVIDQLELELLIASAVRVGTHASAADYKKWQQVVQKRIADQTAEAKTTLFDRLPRQADTLFARLRTE